MTEPTIDRIVLATDASIGAAGHGTAADDGRHGIATSAQWLRTFAAGGDDAGNGTLDAAADARPGR